MDETKRIGPGAIRGMHPDSVADLDDQVARASTNVVGTSVALGKAGLMGIARRAGGGQVQQKKKEQCVKSLAYSTRSG